MFNFSARTVYSLLSLVILLLFIGTGVYYFFNLDKPQQNKAPETFISQTNPINTKIKDVSPASSSSQPLSQTVDNVSDIACFQVCTKSYQCREGLNCLAVNGTKKCVNLGCIENENCSCNQEVQPANYLQEIDQNNLSQNQDIDDQIATDSNLLPDLPRAGNQQLTILILSLGLILGSSGLILFLYLK